MQRAFAIAAGMAIVAALLSCPPPLEVVRVCPLTGEKCQPSDCIDPTPELVATKAPDAAVPPVAPVIAVALPVYQHESPVLIEYWSAPTRTVVLRI